MRCKAEGYVLLAESSNSKLENDVNKMLSQGWELFGYPWMRDGIFFQAMIIDKLPEVAEEKKSKKGRK